MKQYEIQLIKDGVVVKTVEKLGGRHIALEIYNDKKDEWKKEYNAIRLVSIDGDLVKTQFEAKGLINKQLIREAETDNPLDSGLSVISERVNSVINCINGITEDFIVIDNFVNEYNNIHSYVERQKEVILHNLERETALKGIDNIDPSLIRQEARILLLRRKLKMVYESSKRIMKSKDIARATNIEADYTKISDSMIIRETTYNSEEERISKISYIENNFDRYIDFGNGMIKYWNKVAIRGGTNRCGKTIEDIMIEELDLKEIKNSDFNETEIKSSTRLDSLMKDKHIIKVNLNEGTAIPRVKGTTCLVLCGASKSKHMIKQLKKKYRKAEIIENDYVLLSNRKMT